ncbi:MAG: diaminobutyrate--2-oxoglutarate transaminase [Methylobacter sp.]|nr:MAG: diaminobutyrate--2-oxoglutarate transaminase [Methylobacter sp.]
MYVPTQYKGPKVNGALPGPISQQFLSYQERFESTAITYPKNLPISIRKASGSFIEDMDGNVFIDMLSGAGVLCLGHGHPELISEAKNQLSVLTHGLDFPTETKHKFIEKILDLLPENIKDDMRIHFCGPTGSDAIETAIKIAKAHTGRREIISFHGAYHGCTHFTMSLTGLKAPKEQILNTVPGINFFPFPYCLRCPLGLNKSSCNINCIQYLENVLTDTHGGITCPAAVIIEPIQGEGGSIPANREFFQRLRQLTKRLDVPLIVDEIQTGIGRTGSWFAFEHYGIEPDMIVCSKALSGIGQPISVVLYHSKYVWKKGSHIGTFRGNQIAMACGIKNIEIMRRDDILGHVNRMSDISFKFLNKAISNNPVVGDIRGKGLMIGIEIVGPNDNHPNGVLAKQIQKKCLDNGLIVELGGRNDAIIRLLPPLNITEDVLLQGLQILSMAIND